MSCKPVCKLCPNLVISQAVTFTGGNLEINLPAGSYNDCEKYCIVVAQAIPDTTTINAPVYITIGTGTTLYPPTKRNCAQVTAAGIRTRTRYSTVFPRPRPAVRSGCWAIPAAHPATTLPALTAVPLPHPRPEGR